MPTLTCTCRFAAVSKETNAPVLAPLTERAPCETSVSFHAPVPLKGRSNSATKKSLYLLRAPQKPPLSTQPLKRLSPSTLTSASVTPEELWPTHTSVVA